MKKQYLIALTVALFGLGSMSSPTTSFANTGSDPIARFAAQTLDFSHHAKPMGDDHDFDFMVKNSTGHLITELYIDAHDETEWGTDLTGGNDLANGDDVKLVYVPDGDDAEAGKWDMKIVWAEGDNDGHDAVVWEDIPLDHAELVDLHYDDESDKTTAHLS